MGAVKVKENKRSILLALLFIALVVYFVAVIISNTTKAKAQETENNASLAYLASVTDQIENNKNKLENADNPDYMEEFARGEGYAYADEQVYIDSRN